MFISVLHQFLISTLLLLQVLRLEGEYELEPMLFTIQTAIDENRSYLDALKNERCNISICDEFFLNGFLKTKPYIVHHSRHQREVNNRILREQESDYQRSLAADRARLNERKRAESERKMAEIREAEENKKKQEKKEVILFLFKYIISYKVLK